MATPSKVSDHSAVTVATTRTEKTDLLERFHEPKVCNILPTRAEPKPDIFDVLRPKPRTVLGYKISQTDTKVQRQVPVGIQKLHVQQTTAEYELPPPGYVFPEEEPLPPPPPKPKFQYSTGRGPVWEFLDDIWRRKLEKRQKIYREKLAHLILERKKFDGDKKSRAHTSLMKLIGPDWFQELSPKQLNTIDNLKNCIVKDVKNKTILNTQENIAKLGLVLRPDPRHIQTALKKCCECPVEFLLILYQLMNRHRTEYSLNDRLLLSGVVHLTMRETLKELHIRIPSPPPPLKKPKTPIKKKKQKCYKSPYLVPFTFTPESPKHTGIYKNRHRQYPESPYFSYRNELVTELYEERNEENEGSNIDTSKKQSGVTDAQEKEILGEMKVAQREYSSLVDYKPVPRLHKPSIYIPCDHGIKKPPVDKVESSISSDNETNVSVSVEVRVTTDFDEYCEPIRKVCECKITFDETKVPKHRKSESVMIKEEKIENVVLELTKETESSKIDKDRDGSVEKSKIEETQTQEPTKTVAVTTVDLRKAIVTDTIISEKATSGKQAPDVESLRSKTVDKEPIAKLPNLNSYSEDLVTVGRRESSECKCKEEVQKIIETNICQCDRCKADRIEAQNRKKLTYIVSALKEVEGEGNKTIPIIAGVKARKVCDCLQKYQARVKLYEEMKKRFDAQHNLLTLKQQYIIGGVTYSQGGEPVYILSGVLPTYECPCSKFYENQLKEKERLANMPKIPMGKQKHIISGVHESEKGNVFIVSGSAASEDCTCMKIYKAFEDRHTSCIKAYEDYLKKMAIDVEEYTADLARDGRFSSVKPSEPTVEDKGSITALNEPDMNVKISNSQTEGEESTSKNSSKEAQRKGSEGFKLHNETEFSKNTSITNKNISSSYEETKDKSPKTKEICQCGVIEKKDICQCGLIDLDEPCCCEPKANDMEVDTNLNLTLEIKDDKKKKKEKKVCICDPNREPDYTVCICQNIDPSECECGDDSSTESEESVEPELKRYIIFKKIPCDYSEQVEILKKALEVLAEDGFPLAKLPDSYKLPHFKLWMQLRCGKFWTMDDRDKLLLKSMGHWRHTDYCTRKVNLPKLDISEREARKYTWSHAKTVRQMAQEKDTWYYRKLRQANIEDGREFFPSTFSYELPTPNFRDCYFAYTSAKEEECIAWKPWYPHEIKDFSKRKSCF